MSELQQGLLSPLCLLYCWGSLDLGSTHTPHRGSGRHRAAACHSCGAPDSLQCIPANREVRMTKKKTHRYFKKTTVIQGSLCLWIIQSSLTSYWHSRRQFPHLFSYVVPVHITLTSIHLLLVKEAASVRNQQGLAYVLALCHKTENTRARLFSFSTIYKIKQWQVV